MAVSGSVEGRFTVTDTKTVDSIEEWVAIFDVALSKTLNFDDGTSAGEVDIMYARQRTISDGGTIDLDLAGGVTDPYGNTITMAEVVGLAVVNNQYDGGNDNTTNLTIGAAGSPWETWITGTTKTIGPITPGGMFMIFSPDATGLGAVTATTADTLRITNSAGATNTCLIGILGRSA